MQSMQTKLLVLGGGPGGYVAAIRAGQLGIDTVLVDGEGLGGTCLLRGCIPSKALIHVAAEFDSMSRAAGAGGHHGISLTEPPRLDFTQTIGWKNQIVGQLNKGVTALLKRAKVRVLSGWGRFSDAKTCHVDTAEGPITIKAENVLLATGSIPVELPLLPFGGKVISSTEALSLATLPQRLVVVGAGYIGLELGIAFRKMGVAVTVVETQSRILPLYDDVLVAPVKRWMEGAGISLHLQAKAQRLQNAGLLIETKEGKSLELPADHILVTVGRRPRTEGWGLEHMAVDTDGNCVKVDAQCRTSMQGVWAIGDLVGEPMLAHKASAQGEMVAEIIAGKRRRFDPVAIPAVCFTEPEIVNVGLLPEQAKAEVGDITVGTFPFQANGRALSTSSGDTDGFVRVVARSDDHRVLGIQAVGQHVAELSGEFVHALEMGSLLEDIARTIHVHPTLSEAFHEAALKSLGHAIHI
jgi:dihydrolipoamide dehydrogenase